MNEKIEKSTKEWKYVVVVWLIIKLIKKCYVQKIGSRTNLVKKKVKLNFLEKKLKLNIVFIPFYSFLCEIWKMKGLKKTVHTFSIGQ